LFRIAFKQTAIVGLFFGTEEACLLHVPYWIANTSNKWRCQLGMMKKLPVCFSISMLIVSVLQVSNVQANQNSVGKFLGEYRGVSVADPGEIWLPADLDVSISIHDDGFIMKWTTVTELDNGMVERKENTVKFHPTNWPNLYSAAMRPNLFGGWVPLDPFSGDPFMWARFLDSSLIIYAMMITETGAHDMQIYQRILNPGGLAINLQCFLDENPLRVVTGILKRIK